MLEVRLHECCVRPGREYKSCAEIRSSSGLMVCESASRRILVGGISEVWGMLDLW